MNFVIPKELSHLKLDERGYPIPFFAPIVDGKPNFRFADASKLIHCVEKNICAICGKKLYKDYSYIISGPIGMGNRVSTDGAMHRACAEFSIQACPHLFYEKAQRKENETETQHHVIFTKATSVMIVKVVTKFKWALKEEGIFRYQYVSHEEYNYVNGKLEII